VKPVKTMEDQKLSLDSVVDHFKGRMIRYKGRIHEKNERHHLAFHDVLKIAPSYVEIPGGDKIPQYGPTVYGTSTRYDPPGNCKGNFMSYKFQPDNNCYNYGCNIATNTFAQPGRMSGKPIASVQGEDVVASAQADGLILIPGGATASLDDVKRFVRHQLITKEHGHVVGLMISQPDKQIGWGGDYHWCRCDNTWEAVTLGAQMIFSQKDGGDQVTNFDFAGFEIKNPAHANWTVNQANLTNTPSQFRVSYKFYTFMYVPGVKEINII